MLTSPLRGKLMGLAIAASLFGCSHTFNSQAVTPENARLARMVGERLARHERADDARHRAELARLMRVSVVKTRESDRSIMLAFAVDNYAAKAVRHLDLGLIVRMPGGRRIAMTELHAALNLAPHKRVVTHLTFPYTQFGEDTAAMRENMGKPQRLYLDVKEITYANGSDAGYDD